MQNGGTESAQEELLAGIVSLGDAEKRKADLRDKYALLDSEGINIVRFLPSPIP